MKNKLLIYLIASLTGFFSALAGMALFFRLAGYPIWINPNFENSTNKTDTSFYNESSAELLDGRDSIVNVAAYEATTDRELSALSLQEAYNHVAKKAIPGVVSIQVISENNASRPNQQQYRQFFGDDFFQRFFGQRPQNPNAPQRQITSSGSGFVINKEGYIVSNYHVVKDSASIIVFFNNSDKEYQAKVIGVDPDTDIALLKIESDEDFPYLVLGNSDVVETGDIVIAIGNPFGLSHTFTTGVISAKGRTGIANKYENFIQTDTVINPGNSGGPLLNLNGEVIGINSNILSKTQSSIGLGFSIPINMAKTVVEELRATGKVVRGWLGIYYQDVSKEVADALEIASKGVIVQRVVEKSPAEQAGLVAGDIIYKFNNKELRDGKDLLFQISKSKVGDSIRVGLLRNGKKLTKSVRLSEQQPTAIEVNTAPQQPAPGRTISGISIRDMSTHELKNYGKTKPFGVMITELSPESPLSHYGISKGDIIEAVNKTPTPNVAVFEKTIKNIGENKKILFQIRSQDSIYYIVSKL